jgi:hypothetical protein
MTNDDSKPVRIKPHKHPLSDEQRNTLSMLCDLMIPASTDGKMPAASTLGLYDDVSDLSDGDLQTLSGGLDELQAAAQSGLKHSYSDLSAQDAQSVFDDLRPQLRRFAGVFTVQTAARYYSNDQVMVLIGLEPRPPWPQGNTVKQGDWSLLDPVRKRAPMYRDPD